MRIIVLISGNGSNLQAIINAIEAKTLPVTITTVISDNSQAYGLSRAHQAGIATQVITSLDYPERPQYDQQLLAIVNKQQPDLVVLSGFMRILGAPLVKQLAGKIINIHPSLLPKYRGLNTHQRVLQAGDSEHGSSVHFVTPELDGGPIIAQTKIAVLSNDTATTLEQRIKQVEHQLYPRVLSWFANNRVQLTANNIVLLDNSTLNAAGRQCHF